MTRSSTTLAKAEPATPKYRRPKILLVDTNGAVAEALEKEGYNVSSGTFGTPYKVEKSANYLPIQADPSLPNYTEQEVVIVDLVSRSLAPGAKGNKLTPMEDLDWWARCSRGVIDPRPQVMAQFQHDFDRILDNGGVFIVFSDCRQKQELVFARQLPYRGFEIARDIAYDNWCFLSLFSQLAITDDNGEEILTVQQDLPVVRLLAEHLDDAAFFCTFEPQFSIKERWLALATNKYQSVVAGLIAPADQGKNGWVFLLPDIHDKAKLLSSFLKDILPSICPGLFPYARGQKWVHEADYELPSVLRKREQISAMRDETADKVASLEKSIEADQRANCFLYDLLRETGRPLVVAVQKALSLLGFEAIVDVDQEMKDKGRDADLREDLRIHDRSPVLVVDIKGVVGGPSDAEALQALKHSLVYIQEQNRADVRGLTIINHQRLLPPLERENGMPFRKVILDNAAQAKVGLMISWDLFRLVRGFVQHGWTPEQVMPLFYDVGRIRPVPRHYEYVGKVKQVWRNAFSIEVECGEIRKGDCVSVEFPVDFDEQVLTSLQVNNVDVEVAGVGTEVGIGRDERAGKVRVGFSVFRIRTG
jgi:hypothetical protein